MKGGLHMKVLGICGSARKEGNTGFLLKELLESTNKEVELIWLNDLNLNVCLGCRRCEHETRCAQNDGLHFLFGKMLGADAIIFGSPTYWYYVSGLIKNLIDRSISFQYFPTGEDKKEITPSGRRVSAPLMGKIGAAVATAGSQGCDIVVDVIRKRLIEGKRMEYAGCVMAYEIHGPIKEQKHVIEEARQLGRKVSRRLDEKSKLGGRD